MSFTLTEFASTALLLLLGLIAAMVAMRLRGADPARPPIDPSYATSGDLDVAQLDVTARYKRVPDQAFEPLSAAVRNHFIIAFQSVQTQLIVNEHYAHAEGAVAAAIMARGYPPPGYARRGQDRRVDHSVVEYLDAWHDHDASARG